MHISRYSLCALALLAASSPTRAGSSRGFRGGEGDSDLAEVDEAAVDVDDRFVDDADAVEAIELAEVEGESGDMEDTSAALDA